MSRINNAETKDLSSSETEIQETVAEQKEHEPVQKQLETETASETPAESEVKQQQPTVENGNQKKQDHSLPSCPWLVDKQMLRRIDCIVFISSLPQNMNIHIYHHNIPSR